MRINLTDNNIGQRDKQTFIRKDIAALFPIADKTIADLCNDNENLLIFPHYDEKTKDRIEESPIIKIINTNDSDKVRIATGNIMGFIGIDKLRIKINSRFDNGCNDYFLHYMLQKVLSFNLFDLNHNNEQEDVFDFIIFMFPYFLKAALQQGVYREYQHFKYNDSNLKGRIDISRHIAKNMPFVGNIAYATREYSRDNDMTELIRHTIEFIKTKKYGEAILNINQETKENVKAIVDNTPLYNKLERNNIVGKNLRIKNHSYYTEYRPLQILCLQILRMEEMKYGENDEEVCGILFDGAWLWEEYVNTILQEYGFKHPENKLKKGGIYLFEDQTGIRYPDFYKDEMVLDAKYKQLSSYSRVAEVARDDVHQLISYITALQVEKGGFVAPLEQPQSEIPTSYLKGSTASLSIYGIEIVKDAISYADFCDKMKMTETTFIKSIMQQRFQQ
ncbi:5-methylcytosine restriction system specificity protein McrC [Prevotella pallens]|jgi:conserved domain protein|uniref:5-methylcytosine restriction system specificity protein McrC n=1 Tax=Prevotella pallens TaxID=60133 RepID=UPI003C740907